MHSKWYVMANYLGLLLKPVSHGHDITLHGIKLVRYDFLSIQF